MSLREIFRQAEQSAIIRGAHAVNQGQPPDLTSNQGDFFFLCRRDPERAVSTLVELCKTGCRRTWAFRRTRFRC